MTHIDTIRHAARTAEALFPETPPPANRINRNREVEVELDMPVRWSFPIWPGIRIGLAGRRSPLTLRALGIVLTCGAQIAKVWMRGWIARRNANAQRPHWMHTMVPAAMLFWAAVIWGLA